MPLPDYRPVTLSFPQHGGDRDFVFLYRGFELPSSLVGLVPTIPFEVYSRALVKDVLPLLRLLPLAPKYALVAYSKRVGARCRKDRVCPLKGKECSLLKSNVPWCYEPSVDKESDVELASQVVRWWVEDRWVLVLDKEFV